MGIDEKIAHLGFIQGVINGPAADGRFDGISDFSVLLVAIDLAELGANELRGNALLHGGGKLCELHGRRRRRGQQSTTGGDEQAAGFQFPDFHG